MKIHPSSRTLLVALVCSIAAHAFVVYQLTSSEDNTSQTTTAQIVSVTVQAKPDVEKSSPKPEIEATTPPTPPLLSEPVNNTPPPVEPKKIITAKAPAQSKALKPIEEKTPIIIPPQDKTDVINEEPIEPTTIAEPPIESATNTSEVTNKKLVTAIAPSITRPAKILRKVNPEYPKKARRRELEGTVILMATISARGDIEAISLDQSSGHSILDVAATDAVKKWTFEPALVAGQPASTSLAVPVRFSLTNP